MPPKKAAAKKRAAPAKRGAAPRTLTSRAELLERQKVRRSLRWRLIVAGVAIAGLAVFFVVNRGGDAGPCSYDTAATSDPPAGGDIPAETEPAEPGFYTTDSDDVPSDVALIKSMRQGFVVLWYDPQQSADPLHGASDRFGRDLILVPRAGLPKPFVVTAWEERMLCDAYDEPSVIRFTEEHRDGGPEKGFL